MMAQLLVLVLALLCIIVAINCEPIKCVAPEVADYNGEECIRPLKASCTESKQCSTNAHCIGSICVCMKFAKPMEDNLSCEFAYTEDDSLVETEMSKSKGFNHNSAHMGRMGSTPENDTNNSGKVSCSHTPRALQFWTVLLVMLIGSLVQ